MWIHYFVTLEGLLNWTQFDFASQYIGVQKPFDIIFHNPLNTQDFEETSFFFVMWAHYIITHIKKNSMIKGSLELSRTILTCFDLSNLTLRNWHIKNPNSQSGISTWNYMNHSFQLQHSGNVFHFFWFMPCLRHTLGKTHLVVFVGVGNQAQG